MEIGYEADMAPDGGCDIRGRISRGEKPVKGGTIYVHPAGIDEPYPKERSAKVRITDDGKFIIRHVAPGRYIGLIVYDDFIYGSREFTVPEKNSIDFDLTLSTAKISGHIRSARDGKPVDGMFIMVETNHDGPGRSNTAGRTDKDGYYEIQPLDPGLQHIMLLTDWTVYRGPVCFARQVRDIIINDGVGVEVDFDLEAGTCAAVEVMDAKGAPIQNANIHSFYSNDKSGRLEYPSPYKADTSGVAHVVGLPSGTLKARIYINNDLTRYYYSKHAETTVDREARFQVIVEPGAMLTIRAKYPDGASDLWFHAEAKDAEDYVYAINSAHRGKTELKLDVPHCKLFIQLTSVHFAGSAEIDMSDGKAREIDINLKRKE